MKICIQTPQKLLMNQQTRIPKITWFQFENCKTFYGGKDDGKQFVELADRLHESMEIYLGKLVLFDRSDEGIKGREKAKSKSMVIKKPKAEFLEGIMKELRATQYTDRSAKVKISMNIMNSFIFLSNPN